MSQRKNQNKKAISAVAVAGVMALGLTPVWAQQSGSSDRQEQQRGRQEQSQRSGDLISADRLKNSRVVDQQNREIGELSNLFIDPKSGRITRADIDFNSGVFGTGETYSVSWDQLSVSRQGDEMIVAVDQSVVQRVQQASERADRRSTQAQQREQRQGSTVGAYRQGDRSPQAQQRDQQRLSADQMSTEQIRKVQLHLNKEGFNAGSVDGKWNSQTQDAIRNFQEFKGIQATGQLNERTLDELGLDADEFREQSQSERRTGTDQRSR